MSIATLEKERVDRSDKRIRATAFTTVFILAICSAILSYASLYTLAVQAGIHELLASLFPIVIDGLILSGTLLILYFANRGKRSYYGLFLTGVGVVASIAGNVAVSDETITAQLVHAAPPLVLFFALEALSILMRARSKQRIEEEALEESKSTLEPQTSPSEPQEETSQGDDRIEFTEALEEVSEPHVASLKPANTAQNNAQSVDDSNHEPLPMQSPVMTVPDLEPMVFPIATEPVRESQPSAEEEVVSQVPLLITPTALVVQPQAEVASKVATKVATVAVKPVGLDEEFENLATTRLKANWLLDRYPHEDHMVLADMIAGDRKYNRKLFKEEVAKRR